MRKDRCVGFRGCSSCNCRDIGTFSGSNHPAPHWQRKRGGGFTAASRLLYRGSCIVWPSWLSQRCRFDRQVIIVLLYLSVSKQLLLLEYDSTAPWQHNPACGGRREVWPWNKMHTGGLKWQLSHFHDRPQKWDKASVKTETKTSHRTKPPSGKLHQIHKISNI